jgi:hypothetical protein
LITTQGKKAVHGYGRFFGRKLSYAHQKKFHILFVSTKDKCQQWFDIKYSSLKYPTIINLVFKKPNTTTLNDSMMHLKNTLKFGNYVWKFAKRFGIQCT